MPAQNYHIQNLPCNANLANLCIYQAMLELKYYKPLENCHLRIGALFLKRSLLSLFHAFIVRRSLLAKDSVTFVLTFKTNNPSMI